MMHAFLATARALGSIRTQCVCHRRAVSLSAPQAVILLLAPSQQAESQQQQHSEWKDFSQTVLRRLATATH